jgi:hypothetical protein
MGRINNRSSQQRSEFIIIDTMKPLGLFIKRTDFFNTHGIDVPKDAVEEYFDTIIDGVMDAVYHESCAITNLWDYGRILKDRCVKNNQIHEGSVLARAVIELGETLNQQFKDLGAYENHYLGYYYSGRIGHADLILTRFTAQF